MISSQRFAVYRSAKVMLRILGTSQPKTILQCAMAVLEILFPWTQQSWVVSRLPIVVLYTSFFQTRRCRWSLLLSMHWRELFSETILDKSLQYSTLIRFGTKRKIFRASAIVTNSAGETRKCCPFSLILMDAWHICSMDKNHCTDDREEY